VTPDTERQRLEGLITELKKSRVYYEAEAMRPFPAGYILVTKAIRDALIALLAAPPEPVPGLREALTDEVMQRAEEASKDAYVFAQEAGEPVDRRAWAACQAMREVILQASTRAARPADTPTPGMPDRPDHVGQFWGCCWIGVQHAISPQILSWRCVECRCTAFNHHARGCSHESHSKAAPLPPAVAPTEERPTITTVVLANGAPVSAMCAVMDRCCYGESFGQPAVAPAPSGWPEQCICAAIKLPNGEVWRGHRHDNALKVAMDAGVARVDIYNAEQGFITSHNRFVSRAEGADLQRAAGIDSADTKRPVVGDMLFSEDLYLRDWREALPPTSTARDTQR
jgi:hypothetical protein